MDFQIWLVTDFTLFYKLPLLQGADDLRLLTAVMLFFDYHSLTISMFNLFQAMKPQDHA